ncbi:phosphate uptake regulator PhoU, partial [Thermococci archaeon]
ENNLRQGDVVPIVVNPDGSLLILPKEPKEISESKELVISKDISPDMAVRLLISAYIQGYDVIDVKFTEDMPLYKVKIRGTIQNLPGLEIILEEPLRITSKSLLADEEVNLREIIERLTSILISMIEDLMLIREFEKKEVLRDINGLENELDRFYFLTLRAVNKILSGGSIVKDGGFIKRNFDLLGVLFIVRNIERIGDHMVRIAENFDPDLDIAYLREILQKVMAQITQKDLKKIDEIMLELKAHIKSIDYRKSVAMDSYRRILEYLENIGETIINMSLS